MSKKPSDIIYNQILKGWKAERIFKYKNQPLPKNRVIIRFIKNKEIKVFTFVL